MTTDELAQWLILERFRVLGELGRGAMGIVYKVHDDRLDRVIALKTIRKDRFVVEDEPEQEVLDRFRREARAAGKLSHPGIVTIYDISEEGDDLYIAMEFVAGESLGERMRTMPRTPVAEAARIATRVCEALEYAHAHGVIHRDVKPDNIMCCANEDVKLTDFGIARIVSGSATHTGRPLGTPRYMAPEQWRGDPVDGRADVFAVGIILYELLTGCPTFATKSPSELMYRVLHEDPALPTLMNPALPAVIDPIVRRAIAREPADRYPTAGELARALAPFVTGAFATPRVGPEEAVTVLRPQPEEATVSDATLPGGEPGFVTGRTIALATALGVVALAITGVWWAMPPRRSLPMPQAFGVATAAPVAVTRLEETPRAVEATASVASRVTAAAPTPEVAPAYREASATLAGPEQTDATKLAVIATLANDSSDGATDLLLVSTRNASILVSMAAVKALVRRPCARIEGPLTALLIDEEWQRRAWAAKILGVDGCVGARDALAARRGRETDARVAKLVNDAIKMLDEGEADR
jgi:tRNA A-37 threonylcarbamoyl transferase component Bud32